MEAYNIKRNRTANKAASQEDQLASQEEGLKHPSEQAEAALIRRIKKKDLHSFLKCPLCTGFFRDAHTINECLDTFCKSCIYKYFYEDQNRESCPKCNTHLGGRPLETIISDQTIQKIVDLLYPQFKEKDAEAIKTMYKAFADTKPLPRDGNLIDYGVEDSDINM